MRDRDSDRRGDAVTVVLCNAAAPGVGHLLSRRPVSAAIAFAGTVSIGLLMFSTPGSGPGPVLLFLWWSAITIHTMVAVRGRWTRPADQGASVWLSRSGAIGLVLIVFVMVASVRSEAASILDEATDAHRRGDCETTQSLLERLDGAHRVVAGQAVADAAVQSAACEVLTDALGKQEPMDIVGGMGDYVAEPGAVWEGAWVKRAELLLALSVRVPMDRDDYGGWAFDHLAAALEEVPSQAERVRVVVTDYLAEVDALGVDCWSADMYFFLSARGDVEPELAEPVAAFGELVPERLLSCARSQADGYAPGDPMYDYRLEEAIERYVQFLAAFPGHELAAQAEQERAGAVADLDDFHVEEESQDIRQNVESGRYCNSGGAYLDAAPYNGDATGAVFVEGSDDAEAALPDRLAADGVDEVALVMCVAEPGPGEVVDSCEYEIVGTGETRRIDLRGQEVAVEVYELATGELIEQYTEQIGGACPSSVWCTTSDDTSFTCPDAVDAIAGRDDLAAIFDRW